MSYREIDGDLVKLALQGRFDVVAHGCNCQCVMGAGIAPQMAKAFGVHRYPLERPEYKGDINKLGQIQYSRTLTNKPEDDDKFLYVVNAYTQFNYGKNHADGDKKPVDYDAITMVMRKMNHIFKGSHIGLPKIGAGLAGGDWRIISGIIERELKDCNVTIVNYVP